MHRIQTWNKTPPSSALNEVRSRSITYVMTEHSERQVFICASWPAYFNQDMTSTVPIVNGIKPINFVDTLTWTLETALRVVTCDRWRSARPSEAHLLVNDRTFWKCPRRMVEFSLLSCTSMLLAVLQLRIQTWRFERTVIQKTGRHNSLLKSAVLACSIQERWHNVV